MSNKQTEEMREIAQRQLALEAEAGMTAQMEKAREGRFTPLGIDGEHVSPDEYFADEHDAVRDKVRKAYFGVADLELRKKLIKLEREFSRKHDQQTREDLQQAIDAVSKAKAAMGRLPYEWAAILAVGCVALGYYFYKTPGAIAGAVAGLFLGQGLISNKKVEAAANLEQAENDLTELKNTQKISGLSPDLFTDLEALTGEEDKEFTSQSAWGNIIQYESAQKARALASP